MKRIIIFALVLACALVFCVSCSEESKIETEDASEIYLDAKEKTNSLNSFGAEMTIERSFGASEYVSKDVSKTTVKYSNSDSFELYNEYSTDVYVTDGSVISNSRSTYYADRTMFEKASEDEKYFYLVDEAGEAQLAENYSNVSIEIPSELFKESIVERSKGVSAKADAKATEISDLLSSFTGVMDYYYTPVNESFSFSYSDVKLGFKVDEKGYFSEITLEFKASFDAVEGDASVSVKATVAYEIPEGKLEIPAPSDMDAYVPYTGEDEMSQEEFDEQYMNEIFELFDENNEKIADYNKRYVELCQKYSKASVDTLIEAIEMAKLMQE